MPRTKYTAAQKLDIILGLAKTDLSKSAYLKSYGVHPGSFTRWQEFYKQDGLAGLEERTNRTRYSSELKQKAVTAYLNKEGSLNAIRKRFGLRSTKQLRTWIKKFRYNETNNSLTATPSRKQVRTMPKKTTFEERIEVVEYVVKHKHSYTEAAEHFQVSYQQARSWVLKAKNGGYEALVDNRGHHKDEAELTDLDKANLRIRQLEAELKDKELVEQFVKKLLELQRKG
jgi:Transposase and inactivated derivatives